MTTRFEARLLAFGPEERLYRQFAIDQVDKHTKRLKPNALRPQFSVLRSEVIGLPVHVPASGPNGKMNGVAEISVPEARIAEGDLRAECVYEPLGKDTDPPALRAHALIAMVSNAPIGTSLEGCFEVLRAKLIQRLTIVRAASKPAAPPPPPPPTEVAKP